MGLPDVSSVVKGIFTKAANPVDLFANKTTGSGLISTTAPEHPPQHRESSNPDIPDAKSGSNGPASLTGLQLVIRNYLTSALSHSYTLFPAMCHAASLRT